MIIDLFFLVLIFISNLYLVELNIIPTEVSFVCAATCLYFVIKFYFLVFLFVLKNMPLYS
jgi:hypothetical protein